MLSGSRAPNWRIWSRSAAWAEPSTNRTKSALGTIWQRSARSLCALELLGVSGPCARRRKPRAWRLRRRSRQPALKCGRPSIMAAMVPSARAADTG